MNKITNWVKAHTKKAVTIAVVLVLIITFSIAGVAGALGKNAEQNQKHQPQRLNRQLDQHHLKLL